MIVTEISGHFSRHFSLHCAACQASDLKAEQSIMGCTTVPSMSREPGVLYTIIFSDQMFYDRCQVFPIYRATSVEENGFWSHNKFLIDPCSSPPRACKHLTECKEAFCEIMKVKTFNHPREHHCPARTSYIVINSLKIHILKSSSQTEHPLNPIRTAQVRFRA